MQALMQALMQAMWRDMRPALARVAAVLALLAVTSAPAFAHGGGVIRVRAAQVPVGGTIAVSGEKLEKNATLRLELRGTLDNYPIGDAKTDTAGKFSLSVPLPAHVPGGVYSLVAIGPDGDVDARVDLTVGGAATEGTGVGNMPGMPAMAAMPGMGHGTQEMSGMHATDEMMVLRRTTSPGEWIIIAVFIVAAFAGGAILLRKAGQLA